MDERPLVLRKGLRRGHLYLPARSACQLSERLNPHDLFTLHQRLASEAMLGFEQSYSSVVVPSC